MDSDFISYKSTVPSLKFSSMMKIVTKFWEHQCCLESAVFTDAADFDNAKYKFCFSGSSVMVKNVVDKLSVLQVPELMKREIIQYAMPVGQHLLSWLDPKNFRNRGLRILDHIFWTTEGTVDASKIIRSVFDHCRENQIIFMAISNACLEDLVTDAWSQMPEYVKDISSIHNDVLCRKYRYQYHLVIYWLCFCTGELSRLIQIIKSTDEDDIYHDDHSVYKNMFDLSIQTGNELAAKHFWQKLTEEEKNINMMIWVDDLFLCMESHRDVLDRRCPEYSCILFFLLSEMDGCEQQKEVFEKYMENILESLIFDWPWQKYLVQTISVMFPFMEEDVYVKFMSTLVSNVNQGRMEELLFREVWRVSPLKMKMYFVDDKLDGLWFHESVFYKLIECGSFDIVKLIINYASGEDKITFFFYCVQSYVFIFHAIDNIDVVNSFLEDMLASEHEIIKCKALIVNYLKHPRARYWFREFESRAVEKFLKWCFGSEEEINSFKEYIGLEPIRK